MFTSRAEYRLVLRADNADQRLTARGIAAGCVGAERQALFARKAAALEAARQTIRALSLTPTEARRHGLAVNQDGVRRDGMDLLRYPAIDLAALARIWPELAEWPEAVAEQIETEAKYAGYLDRQEADIRAFRRDEGLALPAELDFDAIGSLSNEIRLILKRSRPPTLGAAARLPGVTPAALVALLKHVRRDSEDRRAIA
jgi:tRNA uridine 5-carboxymethylaminomethyl modification enzyme